MISATLLALALPLAMLGSPGAWARTRPASAGGYSVAFEHPNGSPLRTYRWSGATYVLGDYGQRYNIRVRNNSGRRIEAVVTVDGRDVISGELGDYVRQRGYIVPAYQSVLIEGFRQSHTQVAAFRFTDPGDSYSGRRGTAQHVGVVGVAVFKEKHRRRPRPQPIARAPRAKSKRGAGGLGRLGTGYGGAADASAFEDAPAGEPARTRNNLGTRYGESTYSSVVEVPFKRARSRRPDRILSVYYDDASGLAARGIQVDLRYSGTPNPFPAPGFAPPP